ncbi:MAG: DUF2267 domain-containing protein [Pseudomonadota bacterium]
MSASGLEVFDRTVQTANIWLNEVGAHDGIGPDKQRAYHALRAVLFALRDRLSIEEAFHVSAQLPLLIRGIFWESYRPTDKPERFRTREEFLDKVQDNIGQIPPMNAEEASRAVFAVLARHLEGGEIEDVRHLLPEHIRQLFPHA